MKRWLARLAVVCMAVFIGGLVYLNRERGNPVENFNAFCDVFEKDYALFEAKQVSWERLCGEYAGRVDGETSDDELFAVFKGLLEKLDDKHCYIYRFNEIYFSGFGKESHDYVGLLSFDFREKTDAFSLKLIKRKYLKGKYDRMVRLCSVTPPAGIRHVVTAGWLSGGIAYIHLTEMPPGYEKMEEAIARFFAAYGDAKGFVVDIRDNIGGYSLPVKEFARRFADKKYLYAVSRERDHMGGLKGPEYWTLEPGPGGNYSGKPIVLLTNQNTQSAAELFTLMMRALPDVIHVGNRTAGVFADTRVGKLPNGWEYRLSVRQTNDARDRSLEGRGIMPDVLLRNSRDDIENGRDRVVEYAMEYLRSAGERL